MRDLIRSFPNRLQTGLVRGTSMDFQRPGSDIRNVVLAGMGASGNAASLVDMLTFRRIQLPVAVCKSYEIPRYVDPHTLFIACSFSGNTDETNEALKRAHLKRAQILVVSSGGSMVEFATANDLHHIKLPDSPEPRSAIGELVLTLLFLLYHANLIGAAFIRETEHAIACLEQNQDQIQERALYLAHRIRGKLPVIYSGARLHPLAVHFQQQLNQHAGQMAHVNTFPDLNYSELTGWRFPESILPLLQVVYLISPEEHERVGRNMDICRSIFERQSNPVLDISGEGASILEECYYLIHLMDWISVHLALENKIEPGSVDAFSYLRAELQKIK